jgi:hypothetical protein
MPRLYYKGTSDLVIDGGSALSTIIYTSKNENVCTRRTARRGGG